ncbi:Proton-dependent oligopeptide transporter family [Macleaya cordata]|uniref:Proton-dependent oligopeptide transporter family n=1 Tax=Macleaya cordata TaxID=56857 RepID=A0A200QAE0_MACCD|nr:Proton-dependent oligopeptide transporter family [Macleaya cordata]
MFPKKIGSVTGLPDWNRLDFGSNSGIPDGFLNRAALKTEGDTQEDGSIAKPWRLCTVQEVEDLKTLIRIFPLWSTSIFLSIPIGIQSSLVVLQALTMDRHIGPHFKVPAGSFIVSTLTSTAIFLPLLDRFLLPTYQSLTRRPLTPLQRVGIGHVLNIVGMAASGLVEWKRLHVVRSHQLITSSSSSATIVPMSAFWLVIPLSIVGVGEAFHFPGQVALYYQEFPASLHSTSTAMISLLVAVGFYLSTAMINLVQRVTGWLPNNINDGRLDNMFWLLVVIGMINFGYYITCSVLYKYQNVDDHDPSKVDDDDEPKQEED